MAHGWCLAGIQSYLFIGTVWHQDGTKQCKQEEQNHDQGADSRGRSPEQRSGDGKQALSPIGASACLSRAHQWNGHSFLL
jgi:hypothetical protein